VWSSVRHCLKDTGFVEHIVRQGLLLSLVWAGAVKPRDDSNVVSDSDVVSQIALAVDR
jgi:hypothetical protein